MKVKGYEIKPKADLQEADLQEANLQGADLQRANLRECAICALGRLYDMPTN